MKKILFIGLFCISFSLNAMETVHRKYLGKLWNLMKYTKETSSLLKKLSEDIARDENKCECIERYNKAYVPNKENK